MFPLAAVAGQIGASDRCGVMKNAIQFGLFQLSKKFPEIREEPAPEFRRRGRLFGRSGANRSQQEYWNEIRELFHSCMMIVSICVSVQPSAGQKAGFMRVENVV